MTDNVVAFGGQVSDAIAIEPDQILGNAKGVFQELVVIGFDQEGEIQVRASHGSRETLWLMERGRLHLMLETE